MFSNLLVKTAIEGSTGFNLVEPKLMLHSGLKPGRQRPFIGQESVSPEMREEGTHGSIGRLLDGGGRSGLKFLVIGFEVVRRSYFSLKWGCVNFAHFVFWLHTDRIIFIEFSRNYHAQALLLL